MFKPVFDVSVTTDVLDAGPDLHTERETSAHGESLPP